MSFISERYSGRGWSAARVLGPPKPLPKSHRSARREPLPIRMPPLGLGWTRIWCTRGRCNIPFLLSSSTTLASFPMLLCLYSMWFQIGFSVYIPHTSTSGERYGNLVASCSIIDLCEVLDCYVCYDSQIWWVVMRTVAKQVQCLLWNGVVKLGLLLVSKSSLCDLDCWRNSFFGGALYVGVVQDVKPSLGLSLSSRV